MGAKGRVLARAGREVGVSLGSPWGSPKTPASESARVPGFRPVADQSGPVTGSQTPHTMQGNMPCKKDGRAHRPARVTCEYRAW